MVWGWVIYQVTHLREKLCTFYHKPLIVYSSLSRGGSCEIFLICVGTWLCHYAGPIHVAILLRFYGAASLSYLKAASILALWFLETSHSLL